MKTLKIKERSLSDDPRALKILLEWCAANDVPPHLERIDVKTAVRFMDEIQEFTGLGWATATKYLGRLRRYWAYLVMRTPVDRNPFEGLHLERPTVDHLVRSPGLPLSRRSRAPPDLAEPRVGFKA